MSKTARLMKDSGIEWIGEIPVGWDIEKSKYHVDITNGSEPTSDGIIPVYGSGATSFRTCGDYKEGPCVLLGRKGTVDIPRYIEGKYWNVDTAFDIKAKNKLLLKYYYYMACCFDYKFYITQTALPSMTQSNYGNMLIPLPPLPEQQKIADYLDEKCGKIDLVIAKSEEIIEKLKAYKLSLITETVTKGLDPNAPMKDSGIEWIGEIPCHWHILRIKWLLNERNERSLSGKEEPLSMSQKYGLVPTRCMDTIPNMASTFVGAKLCYKNDLVFNKLKAHLGVFAVSHYDGLVSPDYAVYYSNTKVNLKYLEFLFKTPQYIGEFKKKSTGIGAGLTRLYTSDLYSIYCAFPPLPEQQKIADYLDAKCAAIDKNIADRQTLIEKLTAYKKSLIYEAVTGKKEI